MDDSVRPSNCAPLCVSRSAAWKCTNIGKPRCRPYRKSRRPGGLFRRC
ncbi:hypothetical protein LG3211_4722 [Lysobacter gummosus]|nr:hypothetical protein LG3211_4722 [Lysobacter gummosus]